MMVILSQSRNAAAASVCICSITTALGPAIPLYATCCFWGVAAETQPLNHANQYRKSTGASSGTMPKSSSSSSQHCLSGVQMSPSPEGIHAC